MNYDSLVSSIEHDLADMPIVASQGLDDADEARAVEAVVRRHAEDMVARMRLGVEQSRQKRNVPYWILERICNEYQEPN